MEAKGAEMDEMMLVIWAIGFVVSMVVGYFAIKEFNKNPFGIMAPMLPALFGFAFFPLLNFLVSAIVLIFILSEKEGTK